MKRFTLNQKHRPDQPANLRLGFTIVEILIVIVVIGILATITIVAYNGTQQKAKTASLTSDLSNAADQFEILTTNNNSVAPVTMPTDTKISPGNVLQATNTGDTNTYCINGYTSNGSLRMSLSAGGVVQNGLCPGITIGSAIGGTVPLAPRGVNLAPSLSQWTLGSGATYNASTGILTLGATGAATSPLVRLDTPTGISTGADFYATTASPYVAIQPNGAMHNGISYYASDGTTAVMNSTGYTANGCAQSFSLNAWKTADTRCVYSGGPNVIYVKVVFYGTNGGYSSSDLQIKNPIILGN